MPRDRITKPSDFFEQEEHKWTKTWPQRASVMKLQGDEPDSLYIREKIDFADMVNINWEQSSFMLKSAGVKTRVCWFKPLLWRIKTEDIKQDIESLKPFQ